MSIFKEKALFFTLFSCKFFKNKDRFVKEYKKLTLFVQGEGGGVLQDPPPLVFITLILVVWELDI